MVLASLCNISDQCYSKASSDFLTSSSLLEKHCSYCPPQCFITDFNIQPSLWKAPPTWLLNDIKAFVEKSEIPSPSDWSTNWRSHIDSSYLSVELVHETTLVETFTQTVKMTPVDVLSNVGGQTGLWIGISFLSVMELAEMLYRLVRHHYRAMRKTENETRHESKV